MDSGYWRSVIERGDGWMYSGGPSNDLHTWHGYLTRAEAGGHLDGRFAFVHHTRRYPLNEIYDLFPWDLWEETMGSVGTRQVFVVLDNTMEGPSWQHVRRVAERMMGDGLHASHIINWTGSVREPDCPIQTVTLMDAFSGVSFPEHCLPVLEPTHHFIMLARIPRDHRVLAAVEILARGLDAHGFASCGSGDRGPPNGWVFDRLVPAGLRHRFPMLLPGESYSEEQTMEVTINSTTRPEVTGAFCSVICETTHELCSPNVCTAFMTEKSEKAFLLEQVPIWVAARGQVGIARDWGFDVFDDIVDHGYDAEPDPQRRIAMAVDQLEKLCAHPLDHWREYKLAHRGRFARNRQLCFDLRGSFRELQYHKLLRCIDLMPKAG